jgi:hypothetical protein
MSLNGTMKGSPAWSFKSDSTFQLNFKLDKQVLLTGGLPALILIILLIVCQGLH